jgi:acyl dehydratase
VESEVLEVMPSRSRPDRGMVTVLCETFNQRGEVVQMLTAKLVVQRRASEVAAHESLSGGENVATRR